MVLPKCDRKIGVSIPKENENRDNLGFCFKPKNEGYVLTGLSGCAAEGIIIPAKLNGKPVLEIDGNAFYGSPVCRVTI